MKRKLAIITTHPIQYNAPLFTILQENGKIELKVFYTWGETVLKKKYDPGFDKIIEWDIPLLEGYDFEFLKNIASDKGSHHYYGIINPSIIKKITEWQPDALLVYGWKFRSHLKAIRHFNKRIPVWFRGDSILLNEKNNIKSFIKKKVLKWVYKHIDIAFYTGTNNKHYFENSGLRPHQLIAACHAVDNARFNNTGNRYTDAALSLKRGLGIEEHDFVFLFAGKLTPTKDIGNLIRAFAELGNENVHLIIAGNGPEEVTLKKYYSELKNLHFLDFRNQAEMPVIYQCCDVFVLPSIGETWGLAINEAMASGKAILVSDKCGGAIDLVKNGYNGFIFEAGNLADLSLKMQELVSSPDEVKMMQQKSNLLIQRFTFNEFVNAIETELINGKNN